MKEKKKTKLVQLCDGDDEEMVDVFVFCCLDSSLASFFVSFPRLLIPKALVRLKHKCKRELCKSIKWGGWRLKSQTKQNASNDNEQRSTTQRCPRRRDGPIASKQHRRTWDGSDTSASDCASGLASAVLSPRIPRAVNDDKAMQSRQT